MCHSADSFEVEDGVLVSSISLVAVRLEPPRNHSQDRPANPLNAFLVAWVTRQAGFSG